MPRLLEVKETVHGENRDEKVHYVTVYALVQNKEFDTASPFQMNNLVKFVVASLEAKGYSLALLTVEGKLRTRAPLWQPKVEPHFDRDDILIFRFSGLQRPTSRAPSIPTMEDVIFARLFPKGV